MNISQKTIVAVLGMTTILTGIYSCNSDEGVVATNNSAKSTIQTKQKSHNQSINSTELLKNKYDLQEVDFDFDKHPISLENTKLSKTNTSVYKKDETFFLVLKKNSTDFALTKGIS